LPSAAALGSCMRPRSAYAAANNENLQGFLGREP
jgi:hypothetical protein